MPELAEVEYFRKQWNIGVKKKITAVRLNADKKVFRGTDAALLQRILKGASLLGSETHGKQMMFRFSNGGWMGVHLGMTGTLRTAPAKEPVLKHDHLVLTQASQNLIFSDARQFGRILFHHGKTAPEWWTNRPASILSREFTRAIMAEFLKRHGRAPIKAVLLLQSGFPGIGNWMADEILWQSHIHPKRAAGKLSAAEVKTIFDKTRFVCRVALRIVGETYGDLPKTWLFNHRWGSKGKCPIHNAALSREEVGGRTTCWCPICQKA